MSRSPAERAGVARIAVVGAESPGGARLREALAEDGVAGSRVDLYGVTGGQAVLSEYAGEARLIQELDPAEIADHRLIFLCEEGEASRKALRAAPPAALVVDLAGCTLRRSEAPPLVHLDFNPDAAGLHKGIVAVPHPLSIVLAEILHPLETRFGVRRFSAVVLRPVADFGEPGLEELRDQTVSLLRFSDAPKDLFGRQLAFNLIPEDALGRAAETGLEQRVAREVASLLGWAELRATVAIVLVPVFYGHAVAASFELATETALGNLHEAFQGSDREDPIVTPIEAAGERLTHVASVREDGSGGYWLWAVSGEAGAAPAIEAVRLARALGGL